MNIEIKRQKITKTRRIREIEGGLHLGRLVFLLAAVESADPAPAALEDAILRIGIGASRSQNSLDSR